MPGFRTALYQEVTGSASKSKCKGGSCFINVPRDYNVVGAHPKGIYPEYFISICTKNDGYFDGGIMARGEGEWSAFIYGGKAGDTYNKIWKEVSILNKDGQRVELKFKGKKFPDGDYLCLYVDGVLVIKMNANEPCNDPTGKDPAGSEMGPIMEDAAKGGVYKVSHELNLVPNESIGYVYDADYQGRAYFRNAKISEAIPVDESGYPVSYNYSTCANSDESAYSHLVGKCCITSGWSSKGFTSSIDFNNA